MASSWGSVASGCNAEFLNKETDLVEPQPAARPTLPQTPGATPDHATEPMRNWCVILPKTLDPWFPQLADALADGAWLASWKKASTIPYVALAVGFLAPWAWPGILNIYSESLFFLMLVTAASIFSGTWGAAILAGYVVGDCLRVILSFHLVTLLGHVVGYLLLAVLILRIPPLARRLSDIRKRVSADPTLAIAAQGAFRAVVSAGLVFLWCQGTIILIRPVFAGSGWFPTDAAVMQVQVHWPWLVTVAVIATFTRVVLEDFSVSRAVGAPLVAELRALRRASVIDRGTAWEKASAHTQVLLAAIFLTIILTGMYAGWIDPIIVLVVTGAAGAWRAGLIGRVPNGWVNLTDKIPPVVRMAVVPVGGYLISRTIISAFWSTRSFRPWMFGALSTLVLYYALFPRRPLAERGQSTIHQARPAHALR